MDLKSHNIAVTLNERLIRLIRALNRQYKDDPELKEINRDLLRVSKFLELKSTKSIYDENEQNQKS